MWGHPSSTSPEGGCELGVWPKLCASDLSKDWRWAAPSRELRVVGTVKKKPWISWCMMYIDVHWCTVNWTFGFVRWMTGFVSCDMLQCKGQDTTETLVLQILDPTKVCRPLWLEQSVLPQWCLGCNDRRRHFENEERWLQPTNGCNGHGNFMKYPLVVIGLCEALAITSVLPVRWWISG